MTPFTMEVHPEPTRVISRSPEPERVVFVTSRVVVPVSLKHCYNSALIKL